MPMWWEQQFSFFYSNQAQGCLASACTMLITGFSSPWCLFTCFFPSQVLSLCHLHPLPNKQTPCVYSFSISSVFWWLFKLLWYLWYDNLVISTFVRNSLELLPALPFCYPYNFWFLIFSYSYLGSLHLSNILILLLLLRSVNNLCNYLVSVATGQG